MCFCRRKVRSKFKYVDVTIMWFFMEGKITRGELFTVGELEKKQED